MSPDRVLKVGVGLRFGDETLPVGTLALLVRNAHLGRCLALDRFYNKIYFEYDAGFIRRGLHISPLHCPLRPGARPFSAGPFEGLPGVFADSLPDRWGRLLLGRALSVRGAPSNRLSALDRLCHVGGAGMGALVYEPDLAEPAPPGRIDVDDLAVHAEAVLAGGGNEAADELQRLNGAAGGAQPKAVVGLSARGGDVVADTEPLPPGYEPWLLKFQRSAAGGNAGAVEYVYALMARQAGVRMPPARLVPSRSGAGHFAVKRFDRVDGGRLHMHTVGGLLHSSIDDAVLGYQTLINLTMRLTRDIREVERMYRLAVFNVLAHNRDDHAKNFGFLMNRAGEWTLSPAYDLTLSNGPAGGHSTAVAGEGIRPAREDLLRLARAASLPARRAKEIIDRTRSAVADFGTLARRHGVSRDVAEGISRLLAKVDRDGGFAPVRTSGAPVRAAALPGGGMGDRSGDGRSAPGEGHTPVAASDGGAV